MPTVIATADSMIGQRTKTILIQGGQEIQSLMDKFVQVLWSVWSSRYLYFKLGTAYKLSQVRRQ